MTVVVWVAAGVGFVWLARMVMRCRWFEDKSR